LVKTFKHLRKIHSKEPTFRNKKRGLGEKKRLRRKNEGQFPSKPHFPVVHGKRNKGGEKT